MNLARQSVALSKVLCLAALVFPVKFHDRIASTSDVESGKRQTKSKRSFHHVNKVGRAVEHYGADQ
jgi:hypothetical protein